MEALNPLILLVIAVLNAYAAWAALQTRKQIRQLEVNTNSIKDALVATTAKASHSEGVVAGRKEEKDEATARLDKIKPKK